MLQLSRESLETLLTCPICHELMAGPSSLMCGHSFCRACLVKVMRQSSTCPMCRAAYYHGTPQPNVALTSLMEAAFPAEAAEAAAAATATPPMQCPS